VERIEAIHRGAVELLESVALTERALKPDDDAAQTVPDPSADQLKVAFELAESLRRWLTVTEAFLVRSNPEHVTPLRDESMMLASYVLLQRSGVNLDHELWKQLFVRESSLILARIVAMLREQEDAFQIPTGIEYSDFEVSVRAGSLGWEIEGRGELGVANARHPAIDAVELPNQREDGDLSQLSAVGSKLFDALFSGDVGRLFERTRERASAEGRGVRIRIRFARESQLQGLPWELLFDGRDFVALSFDSPVVRQMDWLPAAPAQPVAHPLRILVTVSDPDGVVALDVERERKLLEQAVAPLVSLGIARLDVAPDGTLQAVERLLRSAEAGGRPYHVWHFIGHGHRDGKGNNHLVFETPGKEANRVSGFELGALLGPQRALTLAVINACHSAAGTDAHSAAGTDPDALLAGVSASLLDRGVSAVVGMKTAVSDDIAITFSQQFYEAVVDGLPIEAAVTAGRRAIFFSGNRVEWATPLAFLRSPSGSLFDWGKAAWEVILNVNGAAESG
jgi:hypothetical protein